MSTRLEVLPNELLIHVFMYFDIPSLYRSFWGINQRFNNVLRSLNNCALILKNTDLSLIEIFAPQIAHLKVDTSQSIDFSPFTNLNSLELCQASDSQIEQIRSNLMPNLMNLIISTRLRISFPSELFEEVFSHGFPSLHYACLDRPGISQIPSKSLCVSLHSLKITCMNVNVIPQCLSACPNLFSLDVTYFRQYESPLLPISSTNDHPLEKFSLNDPFNQLPTETLQSLFYYMPNVKYLNLLVACRVPFIHLIESITNGLVQLNRFECEIIGSPNEDMVDLEIIKQMNECFENLQCDKQNNGYRMFFTE